MQQTLPTYLKHILEIDFRALLTIAPELIYNTNQPFNYNTWANIICITHP